MLSFTTPLALLLLTAVPFLIWAGWPQLRLSRNRRDWLSLGLRLTIVLLIILSLAGAQMVRAADELAVVFLIDASDSISVEQAAQAEQFVRESLSRMGPNDQAAVIVFGGNALIERPMSRLNELNQISSRPQTLHSNLAEAIRLGLAIYPAGSARRMVILSDGAATIGDTAEAARLARTNGVQIDYVPLTRPTLESEAWLVDVSAPTRISENESFNLNVRAHSTTDMPAQLRVIADGQIVAEQIVQLRHGGPEINQFSIPLRTGSQGFIRYNVQLEPVQDSFYQNNQLAAFTEISGPPRILIVAPDGTLDDNGQPVPNEAPQLVAALEAAGLETMQIIPEQLPASLANLSNFASVVLVNVNAKELTSRQMNALQTYVRDLGGGLVAVGGPSSYGMGGYFRTPLEEILPVEMQIQDEERFPSVSIVIVIDRSGSMSATEGSLSKIQLAAEGAVRVVELLNDFDEITVIPVDTSPTGQVGPLPAAQRSEAIDRIRQISAGGGGIYVRSGLEAAQEALAQSETQVKHIIVLADGADSEEKEGVPELLDALTAEGVTVSFVAIGNGPDVQWLQDMAVRGNGRFHFTDRAANLPSIFTQETTSIQRSYLIEEPFFPTLGRSNPILSGITAVPQLVGYVGSSPKSTAQVILQTHLEDPLLAAWQYGLGRSVAWTSDATTRWAGEWVRWDEFPRFWSQAVRWTISQGRDSRVETVVRLEENTAVLSVDTRTPTGEFLNNLTLEANVVDPQGNTQNITLEQTAPGRYEGRFQPTAEGAYFLRIAGGDGSEETVIGQTSGWVLGYSPEYQDFNFDPQLLTSIATETGGRNLGQISEAVFAHDLQSESTSRPIWPFLLLTAVLLLPVDVAVRRVVITKADMRRAWAATGGRVFGRTPVEESERTPQMSSLFQAKQRAGTRPTPTPTSSAAQAENAPPPVQRPEASTPPSQPDTFINIKKPPTPTTPPPTPPTHDGSGTLASRLLNKKRQDDSPSD